MIDIFLLDLRSASPPSLYGTRIGETSCQELFGAGIGSGQSWLDSEVLIFTLSTDISVRKPISGIHTKNNPIDSSGNN